MVSPDLRIDTGPPIAVGSAASTASANLRNVSLSFGSPFGSASTRISPSLVFQRPPARAALLQRDRLRLQQLCSSSSAVFSGATNTSCAFCRVASIGIGELLQRIGKRREATAPGPFASRPSCAGCRPSSSATPRFPHRSAPHRPSPD